MDLSADRRVVAFAGTDLISQGDLATVAEAVKRRLDAGDPDAALVLDARTSEQVELDLRGSVADVRGRLAPAAPSVDVAPEEAPPAPRSPGRPKLGVVAREVTLLPRHWEWLSAQPGGASVTLRKLVENARRESGAEDRKREARDATYRLMHVVAGDQAGFEQASRALYADDAQGFSAATEDWPEGLRAHARQLAEVAFGGAGD